jgi:hypothetical protein
VRPDPRGRTGQAGGASPQSAQRRALTRAQSVFVVLVALLVLLELLLVPYETHHANGLTSWLGYHFIWSPPTPELPAEPVVQATLVVTEVAGTLAVALLMFPRGRAPAT